jgi:hypothetical protein
MNAKDDPRTAVTIAKFHDVVRSAEMAASGQAAATHPREVVAASIMRFVHAFDREKAWPSEGEYSDTVLRPRAIRVAELLEQQGLRVRMTK